jgi:hypothetical protein
VYTLEALALADVESGVSWDDLPTMTFASTFLTIGFHREVSPAHTHGVLGISSILVSRLHDTESCDPISDTKVVYVLADLGDLSCDVVAFDVGIVGNGCIQTGRRRRM